MIAHLIEAQADPNWRLLAAKRGCKSPAKPNSLFFSTFATITAISREVMHASLTLSAYRYRWTSPTLGRVLLVLAELVVVLVLCFYKLDPSDQWQWEDVGYRTGFIAAAQLPLVILLAGKNNIVGWLTGVGYEKLNWSHRWVARILFLNVTIHMGFWFTDWARYDYIKVKLKTDVITQRGFSAWCILLWIVLSSMAPIRRWNYEFFFIQHIVTYIGFLAAVYLHLPAEVKVYVWIPIGLVVFDRSVRTLYVLYNNLSLFHPNARRNGILACKATFQPLGSGATRVTINNPPIHWKAGQHVYLACHSISPIQSHPFTISSLPEDGRMEFLIKRRQGTTKRFFAYAQKHQSLPLSMTDIPNSSKVFALIDGPYGHMRSPRQFDSIFLLAGGSGSTFTIPLMREIVARWKDEKSSTWNTPGGAATRYVRFLWVMKSREQYRWFADQLAAVAEDVARLRNENKDVAVELSVYITCDTSLTGEQGRTATEPPVMPHQVPLLETEKGKEPAVTVGVTSSTLPSQQGLASQANERERMCCCTISIEDEDQAVKSASQPECCCNKSSSSVRDSGTSSLSDSSIESSSPLQSLEKPSSQSTIHPSIAVFTGRPQPKQLIRKFLEQALGESGVVVCGPQGLSDNVRQSVVALSDERAIHKGTGAQGVYLHVEGFDY